MRVTLKKNDYFYFSIACWVIISIIFGRTTFSSLIGVWSTRIFSLGRIAVYLLLFIYIYKMKYTRKELVLTSLIIIVLLITAKNSGEIVLLGIVLFAFASKNSNPEAIIDVYFWVHLFVSALTVLLAVGGIIDVNLMNRGVILRHSFGFSHPNSLGMEILIIVICYYLKRWEKISSVEIIIGMVVSGFFLKLSDCRTTLLIVVFFFAFLWIEKLFLKFKKSTRILYYLTLMIFIVLQIITIFMIFFYNSENVIMNRLNNIFSGRFYIMHEHFLKNGISFLGVSPSEIELMGIDNSYARILLVNGFFPWIILMMFSFYMCRQFYKNKSDKFFIAFIAMALSGFMENSFFRTEYNFLLIIGGIYVMKRYSQRKDIQNDKNIIREKIQCGN